MNKSQALKQSSSATVEPTQAKELGWMIKTAREAKGFSSRELGRRTGINDTSILRLEQGSFLIPSPEKLAKIADELELNLADLFALAGYAAPKQLPAWRPYLRAKYSDLPTQAVDELESFFGYLRGKYGASGEGPVGGEDELP
jgi:transcriptional regulator with XRE-family HTH domain